MSGSETWDYMAEAATDYAQEGDPGNDRFYETILYVLNRASSEAAVEFARLVKDGVPEHSARMVVQLTMEHGVAMGTAHGVLDVDYAEWRKRQGVIPADQHPWQ